MSNIKFIIYDTDLDFLQKNAAMVQDGNTKRYALPVMWHHQDNSQLMEMHPTPLQNANEYLKITLKEKGGVSDGYHTFDELYEHRIVNFMTVCKLLSVLPGEGGRVWISRKHSDGSEWEGWFIMGIDTEPGKQITYHLPISKWDECHLIGRSFEKAPEWDGHTSADVLKRLANLL